VFWRDFVGNASVTDLTLRAHQPLGQGGLGQKKGSRNFRGGEPSERTQGEADLRFRVERRVAACENQAQPIVAKGHLFRKSVATRQGRRDGLGRFVKQLILIAPARLIASRVVDQFAVRNRVDPRRGIRWNAVALPIEECRGQGVLHGLFGQVERLRHANQAGNDAARLPPEDLLHGSAKIIHPSVVRHPFSAISFRTSESLSADARNYAWVSRGWPGRVHPARP
jgi:hypothetical protein